MTECNTGGLFVLHRTLKNHYLVIFQYLSVTTDLSKMGEFIETKYRRQYVEIRVITLG